MSTETAAQVRPSQLVFDFAEAIGVDLWDPAHDIIEAACDGVRRVPHQPKTLIVNGDRQAGRSYALAVLSLYRALGGPGGPQRVIYTSYHSVALRAHFERFMRIIEGGEMRNAVGSVSRKVNEQRIALKTGGHILFRNRASRGGRGFAADTLIFDDAETVEEHVVCQALPLLAPVEDAQVIYSYAYDDEGKVPDNPVLQRLEAAVSTQRLLPDAPDYEIVETTVTPWGPDGPVARALREIEQSQTQRG